jgi:hypothetical protein
MPSLYARGEPYKTRAERTAEATHFEASSYLVYSMSDSRSRGSTAFSDDEVTVASRTLRVPLSPRSSIAFRPGKWAKGTIVFDVQRPLEAEGKETGGYNEKEAGPSSSRGASHAGELEVRIQAEGSAAQNALDDIEASLVDSAGDQIELVLTVCLPLAQSLTDSH